MMKKCPKCGSTRVAPILYGMPAFDEEMERQLSNEKLYLGGCCVSDWDPEYHCFACGKDVGSPPILLSKRGTEDYRDIVTSIRFLDGGFFNGPDEVIIKRTASGAFADILPNLIKGYNGAQRSLSEKEWKKLLNRLYCKLYVHEWKKNYHPDGCVLDGEQWELEIRLTGRRVRYYTGDNAFPPYWKELMQMFQPFLNERQKLV